MNSSVFWVVFVILLSINMCYGFRNQPLKLWSEVHTPKLSPATNMQFRTQQLKLPEMKMNIASHSEEQNLEQSHESKTDSYQLQGQSPSNVLVGVRNLLSGKGWKGKEFLTKEKIAKLGLNVLLAYGFVSNFSYVTCVIISWIAHGRKYGKSPLAPGQWKYFLLIYSGFWAANNVIRPARFSFSLLISPAFERFINFFVEKGKLKKTTATALVIFLVNVIGTTSYLVFGLFFATRLARVPLLP